MMRSTRLLRGNFMNYTSPSSRSTCCFNRGNISIKLINKNVHTETKISKSDASVDTSNLKDARVAAVQRDGGTRRWYKKVGIVPTTIGTESGWVVTLDDRQIRTPKDNILFVPSKELALAVAAEWDTMEIILPHAMPMMSQLTTAIDLVPLHRKVVIDSLLSHINYDSICFRVSQNNKLLQEQHAAFEPLIQWFSEQFNVPPPITSNSFQGIQQPEELMTAMQWMLFELDDWTLAGLEALTVATRSFIIAAAVWKDKLTIDEAFKYGRFDENYAFERTGSVQIPGQTDVDQAVAKVKITIAASYLQFLPSSS